VASGKAVPLCIARTTVVVRKTVFDEAGGGGAAGVIGMVMLKPPRKECS
jgi:hypothetical protein